MTEEEIVQIAEFLDKPVGEIRLMHTRPLRNKISLREYPNGECVYFDGMARKCTIYPVRPAQCRTWPFWRSLISSSSTWNSLQRNCPGINQGELVQLEEIEKRASELEL